MSYPGNLYQHYMEVLEGEGFTALASHSSKVIPVKCCYQNLDTLLAFHLAFFNLKIKKNNTESEEFYE